MITVKEAVAKAVAFATEVYSGDLKGLRLEEVEHADGENRWLVTLGHWQEIPQGPLAAFSRDPLHKRVYQVFHVRDTDGEVIAMKLRE